MPKHLDPGFIPSSALPQSRISERVLINAQVSMHRHGSRTYLVKACDLSPHGCKIEFIEKPKLDEHVLVKFDGLDALGGVVCWVNNNAAGVKFDRPIHSAVFAHFIATLR